MNLQEKIINSFVDRIHYDELSNNDHIFLTVLLKRMFLYNQPFYLSKDEKDNLYQVKNPIHTAFEYSGKVVGTDDYVCIYPFEKIIDHDVIKHLYGLKRVEDLLNTSSNDYIVPLRWVSGLPNDAKYFEEKAESTTGKQEMIRIGETVGGPNATLGQFNPPSTKNVQELIELYNRRIIDSTCCLASDFNIDIDNSEPFITRLKCLAKPVTSALSLLYGYEFTLDEIFAPTSEQLVKEADAAIKQAQAREINASTSSIFGGANNDS